MYSIRVRCLPRKAYFAGRIMGGTGEWCSGDLFPTKLSFLVFITYMALFINQGILVTASKTSDNKYMYNTVTVVLLTECCKLVLALILYLKDKPLKGMFLEVAKNYQVFLLYFVPSALYCLYNNLAFVNLATYDPTTYFLLLQFRVVVTGVVFQVLFKKKLSVIQWMSMLMLTVGCVVKEAEHDVSSRNTVQHGGQSSWLQINHFGKMYSIRVRCLPRKAYFAGRIMGGTGEWCSGDLFPTKLSFLVFITYMALFINQGILVTASKTSDNKYMYNTVTVVLLTECCKLVLALILYLKDKPLKGMFLEVAKNYQVFLLYFVPSALYCLYNNLAFVNLATYDPTTYFLLLQFRVVVTGVVFQILFKKKLSVIQWMSMLMLTVGCVVKEVEHDVSSRNTVQHGGQSSWLQINASIVLILLQVFCSCFAGVYNEYLLKDKGCNIHLMLQNVFMYIDSIICNIIILACTGNLLTAFKPDSLASVFHWKVLAIILNGAGIGIVTSLFLKSLNSILKTFASALELMFTAVLCWIIFGIAINAYTVVAILIVSASLLLYSRNPVVNRAKNDPDNTEESVEVSETNNKQSEV
ncbi:UDP-galactose transporter senju [Lingula anatina]|uniref:UDP-galactose transporter senju n=1 Tax=Lingula anatina TaxID=7574 RepID=A0A1S3IGX0_LINAN|nr:UDP-galactose transporter senju [Lingula anatina]|eukprot:XP_013397462.1 UDP-galactose transporter senju [Lingula anatina]